MSRRLLTRDWRVDFLRATGGGNDTDGLLLILEIGNKPLVMRLVSSATVEGSGSRGGDVYMGTGCLYSRRRYRNARYD